MYLVMHSIHPCFVDVLSKLEAKKAKADGKMKFMCPKYGAGKGSRARVDINIMKTHTFEM